MMEDLPTREGVIYNDSTNPKITRDLEEDRFLTITEENISLKKQLKRQEDRIRQLATKLVRSITEKAKLGQRDEILLEDQKNRIRELEGHVAQLRDKLLVSRQQLGSYTKLIPGVTIKKTTRAKATGDFQDSDGGAGGKVVVPDQVTRLLLEAKGENHALREQLKNIQERWAGSNQEIINLKEQFKLKEIEHHDEMQALQKEIESESELKRKKLEDNIHLIRLQRECKKTAGWLATYEAQCKKMEENVNFSNESLRQMEIQLNLSQQELREEQAKNLNLLKEVEANSSIIHQLKELEVQTTALLEENKILKSENEKILANSEEITKRLSKCETEESSLRQHIETLESGLKIEGRAKCELITTLTEEKTRVLALEQSIVLLNEKVLELTSKKEKYKGKIEELEKKLEKPITVTHKEVQHDTFIEKSASCTICNEKMSELSVAQLMLAETKDELIKTKNLLKTQISINKEYEKEIDALSLKLSSMELVHHRECEELMNIFMEKTTKMAELEKTLDVIQQQTRASIITPQIVSKEQETLSILHTNELNNNNSNLIDSEIFEVFDEEVKNKPITAEPIKNNLEPTNDQLNPPTMTIKIEKFTPLDSELLPGRFFITWKHENLPRNYSPIVSDGVFNSTSTHELNDSFKNTEIYVQLHEAIGLSDSLEVADGYINPTPFGLCPLKSMREKNDVGTLSFSYVIKNFKLLEIEADVKLPPTAPPVPIPRKNLNKVLLNNEVHEIEETSSKIVQKSILRRDGSFSQNEKRRVRVNECVEERKFETDPEEESKIEKEEESRNALSDSEITDFSETSFSPSEKRKSRRRQKRDFYETESDFSMLSDSHLNLSSDKSLDNFFQQNQRENNGRNYSSEYSIRIEISYAVFNSNAKFLKNDRIRQFFVEYKFLNYSPDELETELSIPKPKVAQRANFNFAKVFLIDTPEKRKLLKEMIREDLNISFTIVSEPGEDESIDCQDIGYANVSLKKILEKGEDIIEEEIDIYDVDNKLLQIGSLSISIQALNTIISI